MNTSRSELLAETRATAEAEIVVKIINALVADTNSKQFARNRSTRIERWLQLESLAKKQATGLIALAKSTKPRVKRTARTDAIPVQYAEDMQPPATALPPTA